MTSFSVTIDPADIAGSIENLTSFVTTFTQGIQNCLQTVGNQTVLEAKAGCPVATGTLQASIEARPENDEKSYAMTIGTSIPYAAYVELGHRTRGHKSVVAARPFLLPAFEQNTPNLLTLFEGLVEGRA